MNKNKFEFIKNRKHLKLLLGVFFAIIIGQALLLGKLINEKDDKNYQVNLVKISTEKDSIDYRELRQNLVLVDQTVRELNSFLAAKNLSDPRLNMLSKDSISNAVFLSKHSNRYSQYLVDLQTKLQRVPLGIPTDGYISSNFGKRKNPIPPKNILLAALPGKTLVKDSASKANAQMQKNAVPAEADQIQYHKGLDIAVAYGTDVKCTAEGTVIFAGQKGGYGNCIIVSHGNGLATLYAHLSQILVSANQKIAVNEVIAKSGNSGRSTGPHLHYEVHKNNTPVNPRLFTDL